MMNIEPKFDPRLLKDTPDNQLAYFSRKIIGHTHLEQAYNLALDCIEFSARGEIVPIVGPVGVGTTELGRKLYRKYRDEPAVIDENGNVLPTAGAIGLEAPNQAGRLDAAYWKRLLGELLRLGGDILIDNKIYVPPEEFVLTHTVPYSIPASASSDALLQSAVNMLERRRTRVVLINQADRLFPESDPAGCTRSQQMLMDLAARSDVRIVLIGGYQLVRASCNKANWLRRQHTVHFRRYDRNDEQEYRNFVRSLTNLLANMPCDQRLARISEEGVRRFYLSSVGCIGILKRTLLLSLSHALRTGEKMTESFVLQFAPSNVVSREIASEARMGEHLLMDVTEQEVERVLMSPMPLSEGGDAASSSSKPRSSGSGRGFSGRRRIGERKSSRDPVGGRDVNGMH